MTLETKLHRQKGFTIAEILVVISIMGIISTLVIVGFNRTQGKRNLKIAHNEMVTNIRKVQGYMLSSRDVATGVKAKFYIMRFVAGSNEYTIQAIGSNDIFYPNLETIKLPKQVLVNELSISGAGKVEPPCSQIIFAAPYGKMHVDFTKPCEDGVVSIATNPIELVQRADRGLSIALRETQNNTISLVNVKTLSNTVY